MEPKPILTWMQNNRGVWILHPPDDMDSYGITIYKPYGLDSQPWRAVSDYWSDYPDTILIAEDFDTVRLEAEKKWFSFYVNR